MKSFNLFSILLACAILILPSHAFGQDSDYSYRLHVYMSGGALSSDYSFAAPYDITTENYVQEEGNGYGELFSISGEKLADFRFPLKEGSNLLFIPYRPNAGSVTVYGPTTDIQPLILDLSGSAVCNENNTCEEAAGETALVCPHDCLAAATTTPAGEADTGANNRRNATTWLTVLGIGLAGAAAFGIFLFFKRRRDDAR